jgi:formate dehydrogenase major subunit
MGRNLETKGVMSACSQCSLACGVQIVTRGGNVLRVEGDWDSPLNQGLLCNKGRFEPLYDDRVRVEDPMIREKGKLKEVDWSDAVTAAAKALSDAKADGIGAIASTNATNEALLLVNTLFSEALKANSVGTMDVVTAAAGKSAPLSAIEDADLIVVVGTDPVEDLPVASFVIKRTADKGARIVVVGDTDNGLAPFAYKVVAPKDVAQAADLVKRANSPVVVYGADVDQATLTALKEAGDQTQLVALQPGVNTVAASAFGLVKEFDPKGATVVFALAGEEQGDFAWVNQLDKKAFVIAQAGYVSPLTERADVVLPMAIWSERSGTLTSTEGVVRTATQATEPRGSAKADWEILSLLSAELGNKVDGSLQDLSASAAKKLA